MNSFEVAVARLEDVEDAFRMTKDVVAYERDVEKLDVRASLLLVLGPTRAFVRNDGTDDRKVPDENDIAYYKGSTFEELIAAGFEAASWGKPNVAYEEYVSSGVAYPAFRIPVKKPIEFAKRTLTLDGKKELDAVFAFTTYIQGSLWSRWKLEMSLLGSPILEIGERWEDYFDTASSAYNAQDFGTSKKIFHVLSILGHVESQRALASM